jgi:glycosyltransferase involved in cell wall biosynthesis
VITGQNIICFANDWDADPTSKHQVMKILSRTNRVLWVNSIGLRRPSANVEDAARILRKLRQYLRGAVQVHDNIFAVTPLVIPLHNRRWARRLNAWLAGRYVRAQARRLGMKTFQAWVILPSAASIVRHLKPEKVIYYCVDEWSAFSFLDGKSMQEMEAQLIADSDMVFVSAETLLQTKRPLNPRTYLVPHGVDNEHFAQARQAATPIAPELVDLPRPIVGFWGSIHDWVDLEMIAYMARRHPEWSIVLVGRGSCDVGALAGLPNVHLLGGRPYASLPSYAKGFSAAILPFKINRLTESVNPIKLREYLAAGLPVVSTPLPEVKSFSDLVRIGRTPADFTTQVELALEETGEAAASRRVAAIGKDTWHSRVEYMSTLVEGAAL